MRDRARGLRLLGRALAGDAPDDRDAPWSAAAALAAEHRVRPAFWWALASQPAARRALPPRLAATLEHDYRENVARSMLLRRQLTDVVGALAGRDVVALLFKGSRYLVEGPFANIGVRTMADLDIVVPADRFDDAIAALLADGYQPDAGRPFLHPHELPMRDDRRLVQVEVHVALGSPEIADRLAVADAWASSEPGVLDGHAVRLLSATHAAAHNVLHAQLQDRNHAVRGLALHQLHTMLALATTWRDRIDWHAARTYEPAVFDAYGELTRRLFGVVVPAAESRHAATRHARVALASAACGGWPSDLARNLQFALGPAYLDSLYHHHGSPRKLAAARARHLVRVARDRRAEVVGLALARKR